MNKLEIRKTIIPSGYETTVFFVDGKPLYEYISEWLFDKPALLDSISPVDDLAISWTDHYDYEGDARFMKYVLSQNKAITPILSCPDDYDFSCIVIVADVSSQGNQVIWKRIGKVNHSEESFEEEKRSGILFTEAYTDDDWKRYGDSIALVNMNSQEWCEWIGRNWSEELYRRRVNYTYPYFQNEKHIDWFSNCSFVFDRKEYDQIVKCCYSF